MSVRVYGYFLCAVHGEHCAVIISGVVAVNSFVAKLAERLLCGGVCVALHIPFAHSIAFSGLRKCSFLRGAACIVEINEAVLIVNGGGGDDGDGILYCAVLFSLCGNEISCILCTKVVMTANHLVEFINYIFIFVNRNISISRYFCYFNLFYCNSSAAQIAIHIRRFNYKRQAKVNNKSLCTIKSIIQENFFAIVTAVYFNTSIIAVSILCSNLRHILKISQNSLCFAFFIHYGVILKLIKLTGHQSKSRIKCCALIYSNAIIIEFLVVV